MSLFGIIPEYGNIYIRRVKDWNLRKTLISVFCIIVGYKGHQNVTPTGIWKSLLDGVRGTWVNFYWVGAAGISEPLPHL